MPRAIRPQLPQVLDDAFTVDSPDPDVGLWAIALNYFGLPNFHHMLAQSMPARFDDEWKPTFNEQLSFVVGTICSQRLVQHSVSVDWNNPTLPAEAPYRAAVQHIEMFWREHVRIEDDL